MTAKKSKTSSYLTKNKSNWRKEIQSREAIVTSFRLGYGNLSEDTEKACTKYLLDTKMEYVLIYVRMKMGMYLVITQSYATAANYSIRTREKPSCK
jgi:hypothetical protein